MMPRTQSGRTLGWHHPALRGRAHLGASHLAGMSMETLPASAMIPALPDIYDQGLVGSCTANALAGALAMLHLRQGLAPITPDRMGIYWRERNLEGTTGEDAGALLSDGVSVVREGYEAEIEYVPAWDQAWTLPPMPLPADAPRLINSDPLPIEPAAVAWALAGGFPVVVGLSITQAWEDLSGSMLPLPGAAPIGGHALCLVGFKRDPGRMLFRVRNSWGPAWGDGGYAWLPGDWIGLGSCGEAHAIRAVRAAATGSDAVEP